VIGKKFVPLLLRSLDQIRQKIEKRTPELGVSVAPVSFPMSHSDVLVGEVWLCSGQLSLIPEISKIMSSVTQITRRPAMEMFDTVGNSPDTTEWRII